jgi:guanylate kinase
MAMITREQHKELMSLIPYSGNYSRFSRAAEKAVPITAAERAAKRLVKRQEKRREAIRQRLSKKFNMLRAEAREAIYFGGDLKTALKKVKAVREFCK